MDIILIPLLKVTLTLLDLYTWVLVGSIIFSWLMYFGVINTYNQFVSLLGDFFFRLTEPFLGPIRRMLPDLGGLDLSPVVLFLFIYFIREVLIRMTFML